MPRLEMPSARPPHRIRDTPAPRPTATRRVLAAYLPSQVTGIIMSTGIPLLTVHHAARSAAWGEALTGGLCDREAQV